MIEVSVILCTHNPRHDFLTRTLEGLQKQTFSLSQWELLVIDNKSKDPVSTLFDLSWHPLGRHLVEEKLGLTQARLTGIRNAAGKLLIFVDDDNILAPDYIEEAVSIGKNFTQLGAWGGSSVGEYESNPPSWFSKYESFIGVRSVANNLWSNFPAGFSSDPIGAGLVVRKAVANLYEENLKQNSTKLSFDRMGDLLTGSGDIDLARTACKLGLGKGVFKTLQLTHLIPEFRTSEEYILKIAEGTAFSSFLLTHMDNKDKVKDNIFSWVKHQKYIASLSGVDRKVALAIRRGEKKANQKLSIINQTK